MSHRAARWRARANSKYVDVLVDPMEPASVIVDVLNEDGTMARLPTRMEAYRCFSLLKKVRHKRTAVFGDV